MGFFSPWYLAGIAAVGIPVGLHLLRRYRRTPQPFSSLMFFEQRLQSSVKHRRLRYLVLLAMRAALLALLALAFANPFVKRAAALAKRKTLTVIAIDRSFSMRYGKRIEQTKLEARRLIQGLSGRELAQVMAFDSAVEGLTQPTSDRGTLLAAVDSIQPTDQASSYGELVRALKMTEQTTGMDLTVDLVSDMQRTSMPASFRDLQLGSHTVLRLHRIGQANSPNWAVETVTTSAHVYEANHTRLAATITGWQTPQAQRKVSIALDGRILATKNITIPANGRAQVEFLGFDVPYGAHKGEVRIDPHDGLPNDDSYPFSIERSDPRRVLFLYAAGRANQALYYKAAMESAPDTGLTVEAKPVEKAGGESLASYAFVVLNDLGGLPDRLAQPLASYISKGGAALIDLGPSTIREGRVPLSDEAVSEEREIEGAAFVDTQHPALKGAGRFENVQFSATALVATKPGDRVLAKLAGGSPLLIEESMGEGRLLVFASTLDNSSSDFPLHSSFVPFVVETGHYLAGTEDAPSSVVAGTPIMLRRSRDQATAADVVSPDGKHELSLQEASNALSFDVAREGFYEVQRADRRRLLIAVHADRRESDLTTVPDEDLAIWRNTGSTVASQTGTVQQEIRPWSLWRYALALVFFIVLMESVFASRYLKQERQMA